MNPRTLLALAVLTFTATAEARAFDPFREAGIDQHPGALIPMAVPFDNQSGDTVTLRQLARGRPTLLIPLLHNCPNICGVTLSGIAEAVRAQKFTPDRDFSFVAMSIDPKERPSDAGNSMDALTRRYPMLKGHIAALTGSATSIRAVTDALGYRYAWDDRIGQYAHVAASAVLTPDGHLSRWLYGLQPQADDLALALTEAGGGRIGSWSDQLLLLCYHYDLATGRYSSLIWLYLRLAGVACATALLGSVARAWIREWRQGRSHG